MRYGQSWTQWWFRLPERNYRAQLLDIDGPYGLGVKSIPLIDRSVNEGGAKIISGDVLPIPLIETSFSLGARDLAAFEETGSR